MDEGNRGAEEGWESWSERSIGELSRRVFGGEIGTDTVSKIEYWKAQVAGKVESIGGSLGRSEAEALRQGEIFSKDVGKFFEDPEGAAMKFQVYADVNGFEAAIKQPSSAWGTLRGVEGSGLRLRAQKGFSSTVASDDWWDAEVARVRVRWAEMVLERQEQMKVLVRGVSLQQDVGRVASRIGGQRGVRMATRRDAELRRLQRKMVSGLAGNLRVELRKFRRLYREGAHRIPVGTVRQARKVRRAAQKIGIASAARRLLPGQVRLLRAAGRVVAQQVRVAQSH